MKPDIIGTVYEPTGTTLTDSEGNEYPEMAPIPGWHINTPSPVGAWSAYRVEPATPRRRYAGAPTFFYTFPDKETFESYREEDEEGNRYLPQSVLDTVVWVDNSPVPSEITKRQFFYKLLVAGITESDVIAVVDTLPEPDRSFAMIELDKSQVVERDRPLVVQMASALGYDTEEKVDTFFKEAGKL